ncbi:MAG TPA: Crp/Fnr family transcriptional regulator [Salinivirgaceae bacterium]|nr:Crp/Fnr family transcriptional regulator [Salinivirgaceae bacterium]HQA76548.1 Crp/Fnr family transcriptional regulator [Salinivirgaceae bacterium]
MINATQAIETLLNTNEAFLQLKNSEIQSVKKSHEIITYARGVSIFLVGEKPDSLLCLIEGKVKIYLEGVGGREQILRMAQPRGFIGYRALFAEENYAASARALEDCVVVSIPQLVLTQIMASNSMFTRKMMMLMAKELGSANRRTVALTQKHVRARLADSLLFLKETYGCEDDGKTIYAYLSRQDIAGLSNMTTSNAIRTLSNFASEGILDVRGRRIKIRDVNKLKKISDMG